MEKTSLRTPYPENKADLGDANGSLFPTQNPQNFIQWPTEKEIRKVSEQLVRILQVGMRSEAKGDFFKSGDLAYQIQEIIRQTGELTRRSDRVKN